MNRPEDQAIRLLDQAAGVIEELECAARLEHRYLHAVNLTALRVRIHDAVASFKEERDQQCRRLMTGRL